MAGASSSPAEPSPRSSWVVPFISERPGAQIWWLEDDRHLCRLIEDRLKDSGWCLTLFHNPHTLLAAIQRDQPDLLILDRLMPGMDGATLLQRLREQGLALPVLMLSSLGSPHERIEGLALGANDYLAKPFHSRELIWRIERLLQGAPPPPTPSSLPQGPVPLGPLELEPGQCCLRDAEGVEIPLSPGDLALLLALLEPPGTVRSREQLARASGSLIDVARSRSLDVRLSRLRRLLSGLSEGHVKIEAVRGLGYRLSLPTFGTDQKPPVFILLLIMGVGLVALEALRALPSALFWALGLAALLALALFQLRRILRLQAQVADLTQQAIERRAHWEMLLHDQCAPLTRVILRLEDLHADQFPGQDLLDAVLRDLNLMRQLQHQMGVLRGEPGPHVGRQPVELVGMCQRIARHYRSDALQLAVPRLMLRVDVHQLQRVLHNLIDNALEHGSPPVCIRAYAVPGGLVLEVEDRGPALTTVASDLGGGWPHGGLGLVLAIDFCSRHGGRLELEPQPGSGLLVRLRLGPGCLINGPHVVTPQA